jgi:homoserine kinase
MPIIDAAVQAGASAAYLSGAGPTVMAITSGVSSSLPFLSLRKRSPSLPGVTFQASGDIFTQRAQERVDTKVADAMLAAAEQCGTKGKVFITAPAVGNSLSTKRFLYILTSHMPRLSYLISI